MKTAPRALTCALVSVVVLSCQHPNPQLGGTLDAAAYSIFVSGSSVYVAGQYWDGNAWSSCYWQNGIMVPTDGTVALAIYVDSGIVYTSGITSAGGAFWTGTVRTDLPAAGSSRAETIWVTPGGSNVYTGGSWYSGSHWQACLWNGTDRTDLPVSVGVTDSLIHSFSYTPTGAYFAGQRLDSAGWISCYWNWSGLTPQTDLPGGVGSSYSIFDSGGTIYNAGEFYNGKAWIPTLWTGTTPATLPAFGAYGKYSASANGVWVNAGTTYVGGDYYDGANWNPCTWTNGSGPVTLPGASSDSLVNSVYFDGTTLYAAGYYWDGAEYVACYWQGSTKIDLRGMGKAQGINSAAQGRSAPAVGEFLSTKGIPGRSWRP